MALGESLSFTIINSGCREHAACIDSFFWIWLLLSLASARGLNEHFKSPYSLGESRTIIIFITMMNAGFLC
jgi:hypothetical protein